ncbi:MAG: UDP-glucose/GDP-mannose dehydrogenase family protein [Planctomycetaceae bacterium]|nr:UDP-glucose/GDP-mannose dehydrogenase family protein [bacterium]MDG2390920.1 UDP-glucose/GDP-mannose dehydrogenase family protein [Planctomycetaceae bacterium]
MKIAMIGTGYVGLVTGTCLADSNNDVTCIDIDQQKIDNLNQGKIPIYEPGLTELVERNVRKQLLHFTTNYEETIPGCDCVFIAVGTPQGDDGSANLSGLWKVTETLAPLLSKETVVVIKSTVPVGTNRAVLEKLKELSGRDVAVASNPEFLKEGAAIEDFTRPDRVVVGVDKKEVGDILHQLYKPFLRTDHPFILMGLESAEMTKYAANCMLATKISFINEIANLCDRVGANINEVRKGICHDQRIGFQFLYPGVGYGGSCFPKDVRALISVADNVGMNTEILKSVDDVNTLQKKVLFSKIDKYFEGDLRGKKIGIWGLAFKPRTDDIREAPALVLIDDLLAAGAEVAVHDPAAMENVKAIYGDKLTYCQHHYETIKDADALAIVTEWSDFRNPDFEFIAHQMKTPVIFDGRNLFESPRLEGEGFTYCGIGM